MNKMNFNNTLDMKIISEGGIAPAYLKLEKEYYSQFVIIQQQQETITLLRNVLAEKDMYIHNLESQLNGIINGRSWKITKPLRWFVSLFRRR